jgi:hypothetical protein
MKSGGGNNNGGEQKKLSKVDRAEAERSSKGEGLEEFVPDF